jgi:cytoskeleton protein RodZ
MSSIGEKLRNQRLHRGADLDQISKQTKIGVRLLQAIEADQFDQLPGGVFRKSFVLQYARALGLDEKELGPELAQLDPPREDDAFPLKPPARAPLTRISIRRPDWSQIAKPLGSLSVSVAVIFACSLVYGWWQNRRAGQGLSRPASGSTSSQTATPAATTASSDRSSPIRVGLTAGEQTWISVASDGKNVFANLLEPNQSKTIEASEKVRVLIGNAGGLQINFNGRPIGPIGPHGKVRVVVLTPQGYQIVPPRKPADSL